MTRSIYRLTGAVLALVGWGVTAGAAPSGGDWIGTWAASAQPVWTPDFTAPLNMPRTLWLQTIRQVVRVSVGGSKVRVVLSNEYGDSPLPINAAHVARTDSGSAIVAGTDRALTFSGKASVTIPPGAPIVSDPVDLDVPALGSLSVSLYAKDAAPVTTMHWDGVQTAYIAGGDHVADTDFKADTTTASRLFLSEVLVNAAPGATAIVTYGDSITDGNASTRDANRRWPDVLAERLQKEAGGNVAVVNEAISGERILTDRMGANALAHFDRDVIAQPHAATVVLMMGINDVGWPGTALAPTQAAPSADDIIVGYRQLIDRAHMLGMRIIGATLTPFADAFKGAPFEGYYDEAKEQKRIAVNAFIRSGAFDGVLDFDALIRDPANPKHILAKFDSGDHLHPNDAGYKAMAESIDLKVLLGS